MRTRVLVLVFASSTVLARCIDYGVRGSSTPEMSTSAPTGAAPDDDLPPTALISSPTDGATLPGGLQAVRGLVSDAEDAEETLTVWWGSDLDGLLADTTASADGAVSDSLMLSVGDHLLTLWVKDTSGQLGRSDVRVVVDTEDCTIPVEALRADLPCDAKNDDGDDSCLVPGVLSSQSTIFYGGTAGTHLVTLRVRGVAEAKLYHGGSNDGAFFQEGGTPNPLGYNEYSITVSSPAETYYLNRGTSFVRYCYALDYEATIEVDEGATVTLLADSADGAQIINQDVALNPIVVPDLPPAPAAFDGQFVHVEFVSCAP